MKRTSFAVVLALMLAVCFALAGCGKPAVEIESESGAAEPSDDTQSAVSQTESAAESGVSGAAGTSSVQSGTAAGTKGGGAAGNTGAIAKAPAKTNGKAQNGAADDKAQTAGRPANSAYDHYAGPGDEREIAKLIIKYINEERAKEGAIQAVECPGIMTTYSQKCAEKLAVVCYANGKLAHDPDVEKEVATELKFGQYIDFASEYLTWDNVPEGVDWANMKPYYFPAIAESLTLIPFVSLFPESLEETAQDVVGSLHASPEHWAMCGAVKGTGCEDHKYISVGVAFYKDCWYVATHTSDIDRDAHPTLP